MDKLNEAQMAGIESDTAALEEAAGQAETAGQLDRLRELVEFLKASGIAEFDLESAGLKLRLKFQGAQSLVPATAAGTAPAFDMAQLAAMIAGQSAAAPSVSAAQPDTLTAEPAVKNHIVKSPLVGTIYEASSPGAAPFVKVGDVVEVGTVLCIVEAMKLMNEIESDAAGEVIARIVPSGQPVEYGQPLFEIKVL